MNVLSLLFHLRSRDCREMRDGVMFACMISVANSVMAARVHKKFKKKRKRTKAVGTGEDTAPANVREALEHPECEQ